MNSLASNTKCRYFEDKDVPAIADIDPNEWSVSLEDEDPFFLSLFEPFPTAANLLENSNLLSHLVEFECGDDDANSHYTFTTIQSAENQDLDATSSEKCTFFLPHCQEYEGKEHGCLPLSSSKDTHNSQHRPITLDEVLEHCDGTCVPSQVFNELNILGSSNVDVYLNFLSSADAEDGKQPRSADIRSDISRTVVPQRKKIVDLTKKKKPYKVQKITPLVAASDYIKNIIQKYNMELNHILRPIDATNAIRGGMTNSENLFGVQLQNNESSFSGDSIHSVSSSRPSELVMITSRTSPGRPRKERRPTLLKKDANITLDEKLDYYYNVLEEARKNGLSGIFLREQAVSELCLEDLGKTPSYINLVLSNFDGLQAYLNQSSKNNNESYRTIWRIKRSQEDNIVYFEFHLSDELSSPHAEEIEISIFTLIVPGHTIKYLVTSSQYLEMVNFMLGKHYNHAINDNLAEATVGSDGKMIPTQKHHASRVRSHVKKYLKRHVVKDIKRYTTEDRRDTNEFEYRIALHRVAMQCTVKKPFESKVSVALMELHHVRDALIKQAEFFIFKKLD